MSEWKETEIGKIPIDWTVGDFQEDVVVKGRIGWKGYKTSDLVENGPFVIGGTEIKNNVFLDLSQAKCLSQEKYDESPEIMLKEGDIILVTRGNGLADIGYFHASYGEATINPSVIILQSENIESKFLFYYLLSKQGRHQVLSLESGSSIPAIYQADVRKLLYPKPSNKEVGEIIKTIYSIDKKITLLRQQNQDLEELAQTLFKRWFVEFEFPNENGEPYKSSGGNMVASELGEIPEGWQLGTLSDIADLTIGRTPPRKESHWFSTDKNDVKWISIKDMGNSGVFIKKTSEYLTKEAVEKFRVPVIPKNTTILSFKLTVGRVAITTENMLSNEAIAHIRLKEDFDCFQFSYLLLKSYNYDRLGSTSSIATAVNSNSIKNMEVLIPTSNIIKSFDTYTIGIFNKLRNNTEEIQTLTQLRDTLLPKLMSGELRVKM